MGDPNVSFSLFEQGMADLLGKQSELGHGLMGVSKLLNIMNNAGAPSGASVQYKRRSEDGSLIFDTDEKDIERADFQLKMAQLARMVEHLPRKEKLAFSTEMRRHGNTKFAEQLFEEAAELYMQSLVGLDFGEGDDSCLGEARSGIQVPVLCNLAACALHMRKFVRCVLLCDIAIGLVKNSEHGCAGDAKSPSTPPDQMVSPSMLWKAFSRKGTAQLEIGEFASARASFREAVALAPSEADQKAVRRELRRLHQTEVKVKADNQKQKDAFTKAMKRDVSLYKDAPKTRVSSLREAINDTAPHRDVLGIETSESSAKRTSWGGRKIALTSIFVIFAFVVAAANTAVWWPNRGEL